MTKPLTLEIEGFKSIGKMRMELGDLTILLGPPASGKTNVLEALALLGYIATHTIEAEALKALGEEPPPQQPLNRIVRAVTCDDLLNRIALSREAKISLGPLTVNISCRDINKYKVNAELNALLGGLRINVNTILTLARYSEEPLETVGLMGKSEAAKFLGFLANLIRFVEEKEPLIKISRIKVDIDGEVLDGPFIVYSPKFYSFDKLTVLYNIMFGRVSTIIYSHYLFEDASNISAMLYTRKDVYKKVDEVLEDITGVRVVPLSSGQLAFFDGEKEVGPASVSDTALRVLYYVTALEAARGLKAVLEFGADETEIVDEAKIATTSRLLRINIELKPLILAEEPESHVYPLAFTRLVDVIKDSLEEGVSVVISTHSGNLAQQLWDKISSRYRVNVYYLYREPGSVTELYSINMQRLSEELETLEIFTTQPPKALIEQMRELRIVEPIS